MVQVGNPLVGGAGTQTGGVSAATQAQVQASIAQQAANKAAGEAAAAERAASPGANGYSAGVFDPRGAFQVPNNFWGFVMLMMGLK